MKNEKKITYESLRVLVGLTILLVLATWAAQSVVLAQDGSAWISTGNLNVARSSHTATLLSSGKVLVVGGDSTGSAELYDPATGTWSVTGGLNIPRYSHTATLLANGKVLVAGGVPNSGPPPFGITNSAELYDPGTGTWSITGSLNIARWWYTATLLQNGKVLVVGGAGGGNSAELYDPEMGTWSLTGNLMTAPYGRYGQTATLLQSGEVLVAGGSDDGDLASTLASVELYNPATGTWSVTGDLNESRIFHTATLLPNGTVLVAAGYYPNFISVGPGFYAASPTSLNSAEIYDPATGQWTPAGSLNTARHRHTATLLSNGKVLVTAGAQQAPSNPPCGLTQSCLDFGSLLNNAEVYDPATGGWMPTSSLNASRDGHTTTLLQNGEVLLAGGYGASAELYLPDAASLVGLTANVASPQAIGTAITFTATVTGGIAPLQFKWWLFSGGVWSVIRDWSTNSTLSWPAGLAGNYRIGVWVKSSVNSADYPEGNAYNSIPFDISPPPALMLTGISADQNSPQPAGSTTTFTATSSGGQAPHQYKWWVFNGVSWSVAKDWSANATFAWTAGLGGNYLIGVWVKSSGNAADAPEGTAYNSIPFAISAPPALMLTELSSNQNSPQPAGSSITFTATTTGGLSPLQYKWWVFSGGMWSMLKDWSTSSSFAWTAGVGGNYRIGVWVKSSGNPADAPEGNAYNSIPFDISFPPAPTLTGISADQSSPQPAGATINFTAITSGGLAPLQYKWWLFNGGVWSVVKDWSTSNTFSWTAGLGGNYRVGVWVRSNLNPFDAPEGTAYNSIPFDVGVLLTGISADQSSPQPVGSTITFTATTAGGVAPLQYKWWLFNGVAWTVLKDWSTSSSFTWTAEFGGDYRIGVWVKSSGTPADAPEGNAYNSVAFTFSDTRPAPQVRAFSNVPYGFRLTSSEGYSWFVDREGTFSAYQVVRSSTLSDFVVETGWVTFNMPWSFNLVSGRRYAVILTNYTDEYLTIVDEGSVN